MSEQFPVSSSACIYEGTYCGWGGELNTRDLANSISSLASNWGFFTKIGVAKP